MTKNNCKRSGCVDVFRASLVSDATFAGAQEIPVISATDALPSEMQPFSQAMSSRTKRGWVHFYEDDVKFERIWNNPERYIEALSAFDGVITPDFSIYRDMPKVMQEWNIYRSRAFGYALQRARNNVIVNLRFGDERTYETACLGIPKRASFAVGSHGNLKDPDDRRYFSAGLDYAVQKIEPRVIIVYGSAPERIFEKYAHRGIRILPFESTFAQKHEKDN